MEGTTHLFHIHMENRADIFIFMSHAQLITSFYVCGMQNVTMAETLLLTIYNNNFLLDKCEVCKTMLT